jgi:hypothetical protein
VLLGVVNRQNDYPSIIVRFSESKSREKRLNHD